MTYAPAPRSVADRALTLIRNTCGRHSTVELARILGVSSTAVRASLQGALKAGLLRYEAVDGRGWWTLGIGAPEPRGDVR